MATSQSVVNFLICKARIAGVKWPRHFTQLSWTLCWCHFEQANRNVAECPLVCRLSNVITHNMVEQYFSHVFFTFQFFIYQPYK